MKEVGETEQVSNRPERDPAAGRWLWFFWIAIVAAYGVLFALFFHRVGLKDHDQFLVFHELQYWNFKFFGWAKQWTPLLGGGISLAADPQVPFLSLSMSLGYLLGPFYGLRLATIAYFAIGWVGGYFYSGLLGKKFLFRATAASLFIGNGFFVCRLSYGHIDSIPFLTLPLSLWLLHRSLPFPANRRRPTDFARVLLISLLLGACLSVVVDGSPVAIIHYLLWLAVYALVLSLAERSILPVMALLGALSVVAFLDAGYLWPMLKAQNEFPRPCPDRFTNPFCLLWFMLLPVRGKLIPAPHLGHEFSVFIGPVIAYAIWRCRRWILQNLPRSIGLPWLITSLVAIVLGMGSLRVLGAPRFLSPFDLLRTLPGFRSMGVTGRYWGFLALPLAVLGAMAFQRFVGERARIRHFRFWMVLAVLLQLGFQVVTIAEHFVFSRRYVPEPLAAPFPARRPPVPPDTAGAEIEYVYSRDDGFTQGEFITPTRGVINCYNNSDFIRPAMRPGTELIRNISIDGARVRPREALEAGFISWNWIRILTRRTVPPALLARSPAIRLDLNQAYNRHWSASSGEVLKLDSGNLGLEFIPRTLRDGPLELKFNDPVSELGSRVSFFSWLLWLPVLIVTACVFNRSATEKTSPIFKG